ncbi:hypothetical protein HID58_007968 [Brassica napus]|uniref:Uncharacterized protein n=1 Tax=Brassica napus TaxID=3708 RepID=A0ABQ7XHX2_BRANA|nr:hypothetical protein HID58_007968 [Brassica napus]
MLARWSEQERRLMSGMTHGSHTTNGPGPRGSSSLKVSDLLLPETKEWDLAKIKLTLPFHKDQIPGIQPSRMKAADELISLKNTTGEYSTRSARTAEAPTNQVAAPDWLANVWNVKTLEIVKVFIWRSLHDALQQSYASFPEKKRDEPFSNTSFEASQRTKLVDQLETRLEDQFKQATDLIKEIALLEMEVVHLEHYLLSLYRKAFDQQITPNSESKKPKSPSVLTTPTRRLDFCEEPCTTDPLLMMAETEWDPVFTVATPSVQHLRDTISRLEEVDPSKLKHEEKLAFWINVHNALGDASYGTPQNTVKRLLLLLNAAYNFGGTPQLARKQHRAQFLDANVSSWSGGDERLAAYAINHLLHFSLTSGTHSDPRFVYIHQKNQARARKSNELNRSIPESSIQCLKGCRSKSRKAIDWNPPSLHSDILFLEKLPMKFIRIN